MHLPNLNYKLLGIVSVGAVLFGVLNGYVIFPQILKAVLKRNLQLRPGSQMRPLFDKIPFPLDFKVYLFNITNPDDVVKGAKPHLQEVGPYIFDEWKTRENPDENVVDDTIEFTMVDTFTFRPDKSSGLTGDEIITMPHLIIVATLMAVLRDRAPMIPLVTKALDIIFEPKSPFVTAKAMDLMFNGIDIDCDKSDFRAIAVCEAIHTESQGVLVKDEEKKIYTVSLLGHKNGTEVGRFKVYRGIKNIKDLGRIATVNEKAEQNIWDGDECNKIKGTDSTIFPPFMTKEEGLWTFTPDICRSLAAHYVKKSSYAGMPTSLYSLDLGDLKNQPELHCFCHDPPDNCPPKGTMDLMPCIGAPIYGSKPHFLDSDVELLDSVTGLSPNRSLHDVYVNFELRSGTPLSAAKRLQFSMEFAPIEEYEMMSKVQKLMMPLFWIEEGVQLNKTYTNLLKYQLFLALKINSTLKWIGIVGGLFGMCFVGFALYNKQNEVLTTQTVPVVDKNKVSTIAMKNEAILGLNVNNSKSLNERINDVQNGMGKI
ncbi:unnamed protein product [Diamesa serratosioi]